MAPRGLLPHLFDPAAVAACVLWVRQVESEHIAHQHHIMEENGGKLPEPPAYEYLNRRGAYLSVHSYHTGLTFGTSNAFSWRSIPLGKQHPVLQPQGVFAPISTAK